MAGGYNAERIAIENKFIASWATASGVAYSNGEYKPTAGTTFVELMVKPTDADQISLGNNPLHRHLGLISIAIKGAIGSGTGAYLVLADRAAKIFRNAAVFSNILCRTPKIEVVGEIDGWYQISVIVPYQRDESSFT